MRNPGEGEQNRNRAPGAETHSELRHKKHEFGNKELREDTKKKIILKRIERDRLDGTQKRLASRIGLQKKKLGTN